MDWFRLWHDMSPAFEEAMSTEWRRYYDVPCYEWPGMYCAL